MKTLERPRQTTRKPKHDHRVDIDKLADVRAALKPLKAQEKALLARLGKLNTGVHRGHKFIAEVLHGSQERLDTKAIRADMSAKWIEAHTKTTDTCTITVRAIEE